MSNQFHNLSFKERVAQVGINLTERLRNFRPGPGTYITAFCVGATIGEYAVLAGSSNPAAIMTAVTALSAQLGVNLLADIIGNREQPSGLTIEEITQALEERLKNADNLPAVRALLQEFGTLRLALKAWRNSDDERWQRLIDELSNHPQLIASQVTQEVVTALDPRLNNLEERTQHIIDLINDIVIIQNDIKQHLGLDRSRSAIIEEIQASLEKTSRGANF